MKTIQKGSSTKINIQLVKMSLPSGAEGAACKDPDGGYMILINSDLTEEAQTEAFIHEMLHIWHGDFESSTPIGTLEALRHEEVKSIIEKMP